jgi:hypothetical protein
MRFRESRGGVFKISARREFLRIQLEQIAATGYLLLVGILYTKGSFFPRIEFCADEPPRKL